VTLSERADRRERRGAEAVLFGTIVRRRRLVGSVIPSTFRVGCYQVAHTLVLEADPFSKPSKRRTCKSAPS
jgi:hypothetical protein